MINQQNQLLGQQIQVKEKTQVMQTIVLSVGIICGIIAVLNFAFIGIKGLNELTQRNPPVAKVANEFRPFFSVPSADSMETKAINETYNKDQTFFLTLDSNIIALSISGSVKLSRPESYARAILIDSQNNRYLIYNTDELIKDFNFSFSDICEETCNLNPIQTATIEIQVAEAEITLTSVKYLVEGKQIIKTKDQIKEEQYQDKVNRLNSVITEKGFNWYAGETDVSRLPFNEKEKLFKDKLPNTCGFMNYKGGYFNFCKDITGLTNPKAGQAVPDLFDPQNPFIFDWRDRHSQDWVTPVGDQANCGSCWAFGAVGATESAINLYYNQHLDKNLAEQDLVSCSNAGSCSGGNISQTLNYLASTGVVDEACFPYTALDDPCEDRCSNWQDRLWQITSFSSPETELEAKQALLEKGPLAMVYNPWWHLMTLIGFGEIVPEYYFGAGQIAENSPLVGTTYWEVKNSWGISWGDNGYGKLVISSEDFPYDTNFSAIETPVIPPVVESAHSIICVDADNDGYCWWGVTLDKPASCPVSCNRQTEPDCDDSNSAIGACSENYFCGSYQLLPSGENGVFGDYNAYGQSACCGDNLGEYQIQNRCCNSPQKSLQIDEVYNFVFNFSSIQSSNGIAIKEDRVYVADTWNNRIQIFDLEGNFISEFGSYGSFAGQFKHPTSITVTADKIYVADTWNNRIQIFDLEGNFISEFGSAGSGQGEFSWPEGVAVTADKIYVADTYGYRVQIFDLEGNFISEFGSAGSGNGQFNQPKDVAVYNNLIYVLEVSNHRVQIFDLEGNYINQFGSLGSGPGEFYSPQGFTIENDKIYVADLNNARIQILDTSGNYINQAVFSNPLDVVVSEDRIYATTNNGIGVFSLQLLPLCVLTPNLVMANVNQSVSYSQGEFFTLQITIRNEGSMANDVFSLLQTRDNSIMILNPLVAYGNIPFEEEIARDYYFQIFSYQPRFEKVKFNFLMTSGGYSNLEEITILIPPITEDRAN